MNRMDIDSIRAAVELACRAPSAYNTQPWMCRLDSDGLQLEVYADTIRLLPTTDADRCNLLLSCGTLLHHLRVALASVGITANTQRFPDPARPEHIATIDLTPGEFDSGSMELADAIGRRQTDARPFSAYLIPTDQVRQLIACADEHGTTLRLLRLDPTGQFAGGMGAAHPSNIDGDPQLGSSPFSSSVSSHRSPDSTWFSATAPAWNGVPGHFPDGTCDDVDPPPDHATYLVLATPSDDPLSCLRAGEALSEVLLRATALGLATCAWSKPLEASSIRRQVCDHLLDGQASPQLVVRVGQASQSPSPMTPRRAIEEFFQISPRMSAASDGPTEADFLTELSGQPDFSAEPVGILV